MEQPQDADPGGTRFDSGAVWDIVGTFVKHIYKNAWGMFGVCLENVWNTNG